ncbi:MAG: hypothetical protein ACI94Y_002594 [Maribacter sp.]|jgi:hypothetical protein
MKEIKLKNADPDDIDDLITEIEKSFDIKFIGDELIHIQTFGEFSDYIKDKIILDNIDNCTSQQSFYKLRNALNASLGIRIDKITPSTLLVDFLPRKIRKYRIKQIEENLGFNLSILRPPHFVVDFLALLLPFTCFTGLFLCWQYGNLGIWFLIGGLGFSIGGLMITDKIGNELDLQTVGQLAEKMKRVNYLKSRRNSKTCNKNEIKKVLIDWFSYDLGLDKSKLTREARFV